MKYIENTLFDFIEKSPTASHAVQNIKFFLEERGFKEVSEGNFDIALEPGKDYFILHGMSSIAAFRLPENPPCGFSIVAPHGDSPCFKVKSQPEIRVEERYTRLNTEIYGGTPHMLWLDRPLSLAGRLAVKTENGVRILLTDMERNLVMIPSLAIHLQKEVNKGITLNPQKELLPLVGGKDTDILAMLAETTNIKKEDILSFDLYLYSTMKGTVFGANEEFIAAPRLDDLASVFSALSAFASSENKNRCTLLAVFDNEEIGSLTRQGADSTFLSDVFLRICNAYGIHEAEARSLAARSFLVSADNAHAFHPNYPEKSDPTNKVYLNQGIAIKHGPRYATDALSAGIFRYICDNAEIPTQTFYNHSAIPGGSTLGNISGSQLSIPTVDIGLPQLGMHSPYETAGRLDLEYMVNALRHFYESDLLYIEDGLFHIKN